MTQSAQVFIGGCDRSGTTMLASMLGAHPDAGCLPETHFMAELAGSGMSNAEALSRMRRHKRVALLGVDLERETIAKIEASDSFAEMCDIFANTYFTQHGGAEPGGWWIDHTPKNISVALRLAEAFPASKFIHVVRDGRAVAASWLEQDWGPRHIISVADTWAIRIGQGLAAESVLGDRIARVRYEDLVADPHATMGKLAEFLGVPFSSAMGQPTGFALPRHSSGTHSLLADGEGASVSATRVAAWKSKLSERDIELFENRTGDLLSAMGYDRAFDTTRMATRKEQASMLANEFFGRFINIVKRNRRHGFAAFR